MSDTTPSNGLDNSSRSMEDERSESSESLRDRYVTLERNRAERLLEQEICVAATGLPEGGDSQSPFDGSPSLLDIMNMLKNVIDKEVQKELEGAANSLDPEESNQILRKLVHALLEHVEALVSCLDEVRREAENRTAQMQRRLRSSADVTRATVVSLCEWGEEFQDLVSRKCHAEEAAHDMKHMVDALEKENRQLRQHGANLYHDIQSLLTIMNEARITGNWVMDCVTFCEISPEEVYGPVCNISVQQADLAIPDGVIDENPDGHLENSGLDVPEAGITEVCPESNMSSQRPVITDKEMLSLGHHSNSSDSPPRFSTPSSYWNRHQSSKRSTSLPMLPLAAQECSELCNEDSFEQKGRSLDSMPLSWKRSAKKVRRCFISNLSEEEPATPQHKAIKPKTVGLTNTVNTLVNTDSENCTHVTVSIQTGASVTASCAEMHRGPQEYQDVTQTEAAGKTFGVMGTQTDAEYEEQDDASASFPAPVSLLEIENTPELSIGSGIAFLSRSASEESSGLFSSWRKRGRDAQKKRLLFNSSRREPGAPDHRQNAQQVDSAVNTERALVGIDVERSTPVSASVQTDATIVACCESARCRPPELKDVVTQTEASNKAFGITGTQTDVEWENFPSTGDQEGDRELRSLKERLNLAAEEVQSKNMLATQLQTHLDSSLKQVEMSIQALQNVERKLQLSREECENLKKQLTSTQGKLEDAEKAVEMERMTNAQSKAEIQNLVLTVQHLQATLVNLKKNGGPSPKESSSGIMPKVHDV